MLVIGITEGLLFVSCSPSTDGDEKTAEQLVEEGWQAFSSKNYQLAARRFDEALGKDVNYIEAYDGAGWSYAKFNNLTVSENRFLTGLSKDSVRYQMRAGLAVLRHAQKRYNESAAILEQLLALEVNWQFRGDTSIGVADLRLLLAENYFALANYTASLTHVRVLNPNFNADVSTVRGQAALALEIERLRGIV